MIIFYFSEKRVVPTGHSSVEFDGKIIDDRENKELRRRFFHGEESRLL